MRMSAEIELVVGAKATLGEGAIWHAAKACLYWVAHRGAGAVCRWNPDDGTLMERIDVPAAHVSSCAFGGEDLRDLYVTTARSGLSEAQLAEQPLAGGLFRARPGVKGVPAFEFAG
jgi:sugar lactone lactonase YvrE